MNNPRTKFKIKMQDLKIIRTIISWLKTNFIMRNKNNLWKEILYKHLAEIVWIKDFNKKIQNSIKLSKISNKLILQKKVNWFSIFRIMNLTIISMLSTLVFKQKFFREILRIQKNQKIKWSILYVKLFQVNQKVKNQLNQIFNGNQWL